MHNKTSAAPLACVFFSDLRPWERVGVEATLKALSSRFSLDVKDAAPGASYASLDLEASKVWLLTKNWKTVWPRFRRGLPDYAECYFSLFQSQFTPVSLPSLFLRRFSTRFPERVKLVAHSPMAARFWEEMQSVPPAQIVRAPFAPLQLSGLQRRDKKSAQPLVVGTFAPFVSESNLNYFLNIAHYVTRREESVLFRIFGAGSLYRHLNSLIEELGLEERVSITECFGYEHLGEIDLFLYLPLRNDHFLPLLAASAYELPVLSAAVVGVEDFLVDGRDSYIVSVNDTRPMGELVLRLLSDTGLRHALGQRLRQSLERKFSEAEIQARYGEVFWGQRVSAEPVSALQPAA